MASQLLVCMPATTWSSLIQKAVVRLVNSPRITSSS